MNKLGNKFLLAFFSLWAVLSCTPILDKSSYQAILLAIAIPLLFANQRPLRKKRALVFAVLSYITLAVLYKFVGYSSASWGNYKNQFLFFLPMLLLLVMKYKLSDQYSRYLWWMMVIIMTFNIVDNIRLSILYPQLNNVSRFYLDEDFLASINAGGTSFYTFSLFFFNVCFFVFLNTKKRLIKFASLTVAIISSIYILFYCLKGSVVVFYLLSIVLQFFAYKTKNTTLFFMVLGYSAIGMVIALVFFQEEIVDFIISVSPGERLTTRLVTLVDADNEEANTFTVTGRTNLYLMSIETWLSNILNFFFGIGDHRAAFGAAATGISQHSDLLDTLARYGLLGLIPIFLTFKYYFKYILSLFDKKFKLQLITIFFILILFGVVRGIFNAGLGCTMFLLLPLCNVLVNEKQQ